MYWYERYPVAAEDFWHCLDWLSYGQVSVYFAGDIKYEFLKKQISINGAHAISLAHTEYQNDPIMLAKFLVHARYQFPDITVFPIFRHLVLSATQNARRVQDEDRRITLERMRAQRINNVSRQVPRALPQQGRL